MDEKKSKYVLKENHKRRYQRMDFLLILFILPILAITGCAKKSGSDLTELKPQNADQESVKGKGTVKDEKSEKSTKQEKKADESKEEPQDREGSAKVFVYVCGAVNAPGVYGLSQDSRVYEAIAMAGGLSSEAVGEALNQASLVKDGERVYIPSKSDLEKGIAVADIPEPAGSGALNSDKININTSTKEELMTLPGIGAAKAASIISHRETNGRFTSTEQLMEIEGIKEGVYHKIKDRITS